jgi:predicted ester cyclase
MAILREHVRAESEHDIDALIGGMTPDCFNDVVGALEPFVGPLQTAERYRKHWEGFPDFTVRIRRILCADEWCVVTENEWRGTHLGTFLGWPATVASGRFSKSR